MKFLILGYGNMGKGYGKTLSSLNIPFDYYDPPLGKNKFCEFTHAIITTPIKYHFNSYSLIKNIIPDENIFIIKPIIGNLSEKELLNKRIFHGMPERYNPVIPYLQEIKSASTITFTRFNDRKTDGMPIIDLGIHDLDLFCEYIFYDHKLIYKKSFEDFYIIEFQNNDQQVIIKGGFGEKERSIKTENKTLDLLVKPNYEKQIKDFISGIYSNAKLAHRFAFD